MGKRGNVNLADFVKLVAEKSGVPQRQVRPVVRATLDCLEDIFLEAVKQRKEGVVVTFAGFGSFEVRYYKMREYVIPTLDYKVVLMPPRARASFKPSVTLRRKMLEAMGSKER